MNLSVVWSLVVPINDRGAATLLCEYGRGLATRILAALFEGHGYFSRADAAAGRVFGQGGLGTLGGVSPKICKTTRETRAYGSEITEVWGILRDCFSSDRLIDHYHSLYN
jgi:hypothetical protein